MKLPNSLKFWEKGSKNQKNVKLNHAKKYQITEVSPAADPSFSFYNFLNENGWQYLSAYQALMYYQKTAPLFTAIDTIGKEVQTIQPYVFDTKKQEYVKDHPILDLLKKPNTDSTYSEFIYKFLAFYIITGNNYTIATGAITQPPLELFIGYPQTVSITPGTDGFPQNYLISQFYQSENFTRYIDKGRFRFVNQSGGKELYQSKFFSPIANLGALYGMSYLTPIYHEIEQYLLASMHNEGILSNGATPSLVLESDQPLMPDTLQRLEEQMRLFYAGAQNAGRTMILEQGLKANKVSMSNKDMDFAELKKEVKYTIYSELRIPLPKISADNMTLANMETAKLDLYDNAVLPFTKIIFEELTNFLMPRYKNSENLVLKFDESEIEALALRRNEQIKIKKDTGVFTTNEIRAMYKMKPLLNGDTLYRPSNELPVNVSNEELEELIQLLHPQKSASNNIDNEKEKDDEKKRLVELMRSQKNAYGKQLFSDKEIENIINE